MSLPCASDPVSRFVAVVAGTAATRAAAFGCGAIAFVVGAWIALHHPLSTEWALCAFAAWCAAAYRWPQAMAQVLLACLPVLGLAPWTGWVGVDEFDIAALATIAGGYAARARQGVHTSVVASEGFDRTMAVCLGLGALFWLGLGLARAEALRFDWFDAYQEPLNSLRIAKGHVWALLILPLLVGRSGVGQTSGRSGLPIVPGIAISLLLVAVVVLWERLAFTGLFNTDIYYRSAALFWEMHVGGAAIEVFLVLALPFAVALAATGRDKRVRLSAVALLVLAVYACASTLSRSLYLALAVAVIPAAWVVAARRRAEAPPDRSGFAWRLAGALLLVTLGTFTTRWLVRETGYGGALLGAAVVWGGGTALLFGLGAATAKVRRGRASGSLAVALVLLVELGALHEGAAYLTRRLDRIADDFVQRTAHWQGALATLASPADWLVGRGFGRFPVDYPARSSKVELPGGFRIVDAEGARFAHIDGPATLRGIAGVFGLSQRIGPAHGERFTMRFDARAPRALPVWVSLCEKHMIYEAECVGAVVRVSSAEWQAVTLEIDAARLAGGPWYAPRPVLLSVASGTRGAAGVDIDNLRVIGADGRDRVANGNFSAGAARWFLTGRYYFLPWHADSLPIELLVERGVIGLVFFAVLFWRALTAWGGRAGRGDPQAPYVVAALSGCLALGLLGSVLDVPRNAFLLTLLCLLRPRPMAAAQGARAAPVPSA